MPKHTGLGKGLDSLIPGGYKKPETAAAQKKEVKQDNKEQIFDNGEAVVTLKITQITPNRQQPRKNFDKESLSQLAESIKTHGIIQPLIVIAKGKGYEIVAGERRYRAAQMAGLTEIPVIVKKYEEKERDEIALLENIQREDLNAIEEAQAYEKLIGQYGLKQDDLAKRLGKSRSVITNHLRLLKLPKSVQDMVTDGKISEGHARAILSAEGAAKQEKIAKLIIEKGLSVRQAEALAKTEDKPAKKRAKKTAQDEIYAKLESDLRQIMSTKVSIKKETEEKGKIVIEYYSLDELDRLTGLFRKGGEE